MRGQAPAAPGAKLLRRRGGMKFAKVPTFASGKILKHISPYILYIYAGTLGFLSAPYSASLEGVCP